MLAKIDHAWRWFGTAFSYLMFGVGGVITPFFIAPVLYCMPGDERIRARRVRRSIHYLLLTYTKMMRFLGVLTYQIDNIEKLKEARLILANHPSLLDVVFLISMVPNANCVVKGKLTRNFFMRGAIRVAGYIMNEEAAEVIDAANRAIDDGQVLIIFPEGTRTTPSEKMQFKRGAANIAIRTGSDITPVLIYCNPTTLTRNERWYQVPDKRIHFRIQVQDQLNINPYLKNQVPSRGARYLSRDLIDYFNQELEANG